MTTENSSSNVLHGRVRGVAMLVSVVSVLILVRSLPLEAYRDRLEAWLGELGPWGPIAFALVYILATIAMLPGSMLTLAGSAVFGFWEAYIAVTVGSVTGAALAFLIARHVARRKVETMARQYPKFAAVDEAISKGGWRVVALMRLSPAVPFNLQNYLYGLTRIRFWPYVLTSWLAMIPGTLMYVYIGHAAGEAATNRQKTPAEWTLLGVGLLATVVVTVYITRLAKRELAKQTELATEPAAPEDTSFPVLAVLTAIVLLTLATISIIR